MRAVLQRVSRASVDVAGERVGEIGRGLLVLLGVGQDDTEATAAQLVDKVARLRIFEDEAGKMNLSLLDIKGEALVVSQFTLFADTRKGRRPSFVQAAPLERANALYTCFSEQLRALGVQVANGRFQAHMDVSLVNDGPVTIWLDTAG